MTALTPYGLTCEMLAEPLGLDEPSPRLSWKLASSRRGDHQTAYRLTVALTEPDLDTGRLLWDTGRRATGDTLLIAYDGAPLQPAARYHWRVEVWDAEGEPTGRDGSWFETGLLRPAEWRASWIARDPGAAAVQDPPTDADRSERTRHLQPCAHLRRDFRVDAPPVRARAYVSARGLYELRINGHRVGDAELAPDWTEYRHRVLYQTYDVGDLLRDGANTVGAILADGWWSGFVGFDSRRQALHYGEAPQLIVQLLLDFADGSRRWVASDGSWREHSGPIRYSDLLMGEYVDAREELPGWDEPGYDDGDWTPVIVADDDTSVLEASSDRPVRVLEELPAASVRQRPDGRFIVDLGQNMVGCVRLTIRGAEAGRRIRLRYAEMLTGDGEELYLDNLRTAEATDVHIAAGRPVEVFQPRFTFHGFRYVEVTGYPERLRPEDVVGRVLHSDLPWTGEFACSDETVMRLHSNIRWGLRGNFVSIPTDCPQRDERLGWLADAQVFLPTACRNADVAAFFARWMRDVVSAQHPDGAFGDVVPELCMTREGAPAWGDGGVIIPWQLYRVYGDRRVLERSYAAMKAWVDHVHRANPGLIWRHRVGNHYGDWLQVGAETPREVLATAYFARSAELVARTARVLGAGDDAEHYTALHGDIREAFISAFVDTGQGRVHGGTQTAYLLALAFDLLPPEVVPAAVEHLAADVRARDGHLTTGFVGVALLCPVLSAHGHHDLAYALLHQDTYPSWGYSIRHGATTIWERWDGWTEEGGFQSPAMNSFNHYSLGSVGEWLYGGVAGIDQAPDSVAYREVLLRPAVGGRLTWARARQETARGTVECGWSLLGEELSVQVAVPPGAHATLTVPTLAPGDVREGDHPVDGRDDIRVTARTERSLTVRIGSGHYLFSAAPPSQVPSEGLPTP